MKKPLLKSFFTYWEAEPQNLAYMRDWAQRIPCAWQPGCMMRQIDELNDLEIEASVRDYLYRKLYWTGIQDSGSAAFVDSPVDLLRYQDANSGMNGGKGPSWECGPFSATYVGMLAALNIPARRLYASRSTDGQPDYGAEVWLDNRWVVVVPHLNLHFEDYSGRLDSRRLCSMDRLGLPYTPISIAGQGQPAHIADPIHLDRWNGMSGLMCIRRGNRPHAGGSPLKPEHWEHLPVLAPIGNAKLPTDNYVEHGTFDPRSITNAP